MRKPSDSNPDETTVSEPTVFWPWTNFGSFAGTTRPSAPACEQTKYMFWSGSKEDGGQLSPPTAAFGVRLIELGSELIGAKIFVPTTFGFGVSPETASSAVLTASGVVSIGLNGGIVGSGWVGQVFCDGSCGTFTSGIG